MGTLTKVFDLESLENIHPLTRMKIELPFEFVEKVFENLDVTDNTRTQYLWNIKRFLTWVDEEGWSSDVLMRYKTYLRNDVSLSTSSKNKYLVVGRVFVGRLMDLKLTTWDFQIPKTFKVSKGHKRQPLTKENISRILDHVKENSELNTLVHLLYFQGLRSTEVRHLEIEDIEISNGGCYISGKGRDGDKEWIRFHPRTIEVLKNYLSELDRSSGYVFSGRSEGTPMSGPTFWRRIKGIFSDLEIDSNPHSFRKSFVSGLIEGGLDLITVSNFSRHKTITQLQVYFDRIDLERSFPQFVESLEV